jgi:sec-independent protein translocase protein TatC
MDSEEKQPFLSHLEELRKRLIACAIAAAVGFGIAYSFSGRLFEVLISPLKAVMPEGNHLIFTSLPEMFMTELKVAFVAGILLTSPFLFYEMWMFVAPGLYRHEKRLAIPFILASTVLFISGALFGYFVVFPFGFKFFMGYSNEFVKAMPSVKEYFSFALGLLFAFGVVFELPVVLFFLAKLGIVSQEFLRKQRKYAILLIFMISALLTPTPDVINQCLMAVPLMVLYEVGIILAGLARSKKTEEEPTEAQPEATQADE